MVSILQKTAILQSCRNVRLELGRWIGLDFVGCDVNRWILDS